ncbi:MAG: hypothetical protein KJO29_06515 [Bacteroidia bacterium]|nr:hypothetical protein [Bacteroidia bacterium]
MKVLSEGVLPRPEPGWLAAIIKRKYLFLETRRERTVAYAFVWINKTDVMSVGINEMIIAGIEPSDHQEKK